VLVALVAALERYDAAGDPSRPVSDRRAAISELIRVAGIGVLLFMGLVGVIALLEVGALAFVPVALVALAIGTRFYLAYAGDLTPLAAPLRIVTAALIVAVMVMWFARTASAVAEILR
jgi:hypothetical protein